MVTLCKRSCSRNSERERIEIWREQCNAGGHHAQNLRRHRQGRGLIPLNERIEKAKIPSSKLDESLNMATWNIREFDASQRTEAAIYQIVEIIRQFDQFGIVELMDNLKDLSRVLEVLGLTWRVLYLDSIRDYGGNWERVAYVYDKRAVTHTGFAAAAQPPRSSNGAANPRPDTPSIVA